jgi:hypothetical protein
MKTQLDLKEAKLDMLEKQSEARRRQHLDASGELRKNVDELQAWEQRKQEWANEKVRFKRDRVLVFYWPSAQDVCGARADSRTHCTLCSSPHCAPILGPARSKC